MVEKKLTVYSPLLSLAKEFFGKEKFGVKRWKECFKWNALKIGNLKVEFDLILEI